MDYNDNGLFLCLEIIKSKEIVTIQVKKPQSIFFNKIKMNDLNESGLCKMSVNTKLFYL